MSFKRFDPEDIVLSSELITFPTWYTQKDGDTDTLDKDSIVANPNQGRSVNYYTDYYSAYFEEVTPPTGSDTGSTDPTGSFDSNHSKPLFSLAFAKRPKDGFVTYSYNQSGSQSPLDPAYIVYGQYRSLVLGDEYSDFTFGTTIIGNDSNIEQDLVADSFVALTVDRSRFREKLDPDTCRLMFKTTISGSEELILAPDTSATKRYLDAGRVFDLAKCVVDESGSVHFEYPKIGDLQTSYGYFLPDIGIILFNTSDSGSLFGLNIEGVAEASDNNTAIEQFFNCIETFKLRSQETVTSNFVFVRARNGEFNYSTNPSNIVGDAGNLRHNIMINQPQSFVTTVGLYNDANELVAVAKLSRPLVKDFTKEALIRIKLDY